MLVYLLATGRGRRLFPGVGWFVLGTAITILPLALLVWQRPEILLGRLGQVSILNPAVGGDATLFTVFWRQSWHALGLFFIEGDRILRHNPPGRPLFDLLMAGPFLVGLFWSLRHWRQPAAAFLLLWSVVMLAPTILAEDAPHFLRAVGILPAALFFPALGLERLWHWMKGWPAVRPLLTAGLLLGSLILTVNDYFLKYGREAQTAYWFEAAARNLAENINSYEVSEADYYLDQRLWDGWPAVRFLVQPEQRPTLFRPEEVTTGQFTSPAVVYVWPYDRLDHLLNGFGPGLVGVAKGELAQGDLEAAPYPFYYRYTIEPAPDWPVLAKFDNSIQLRHANVIELDEQPGLKIELYWSTTAMIDESLIVFVHLVGAEGIVAQSDTVPVQGTWPTESWQSGLILTDQHTIDLAGALDSGQYQIIVGFYHADTKERLAVYTAEGTPVGDTWLLRP
jgi:hypothetical protein